MEGEGRAGLSHRNGEFFRLYLTSRNGLGHERRWSAARGASNRQTL